MVFKQKLVNSGIGDRNDPSLAWVVEPKEGWVYIFPVRTEHLHLDTRTDVEWRQINLSIVRIIGNLPYSTYVPIPGLDWAEVSRGQLLFP